MFTYNCNLWCSIRLSYLCYRRWWNTQDQLDSWHQQVELHGHVKWWFPFPNMDSKQRLENHSQHSPRSYSWWSRQLLGLLSYDLQVFLLVFLPLRSHHHNLLIASISLHLNFNFLIFSTGWLCLSLMQWFSWSDFLYHPLQNLLALHHSQFLEPKFQSSCYKNL